MMTTDTTKPPICVIRGGKRASLPSRRVRPLKRVSPVKPCLCPSVDFDARRTISNGMRVIRAKFGLETSSSSPHFLADPAPSDLSLFLLRRLNPGTQLGLPSPRGSYGQRLPRHQRWELALSISSMKKSLPVNKCKNRRKTPGCCAPLSSFPSWFANARKSPPPVDPEFVKHIRETVHSYLPPGWDRRYSSYVRNYVPQAKARENKDEPADRAWMGSRDEFVSACTGPPSSSERRISGRYKEIATPGKKRPMLIFNSNIDLLGPLHRCMYDAIEKNNAWLLRGPPTADRISHLPFPLLTSTDFCSATDNIPVEVTEAILSAALDHATHVNMQVRKLARQSLTPELYKSGGVHLTHGQNMGSYLSFPLLCLFSAVVASWATRHTSASFLINGDDTLISSVDRLTVRDWPEFVKINELKTIFNSGNVCDINSTVFLRRSNGWHEVRHMRRGGGPDTLEGAVRAATACSQNTKWTNAFISSGVFRAFQLEPYDLGLRGYRAWQRSCANTYRHPSLDVKSEADPRLEKISRKATAEETESVREVIWRGGRFRGGGGRREDKWTSLRKWKRGLLRKQRKRGWSGHFLSYSESGFDCRPPGTRKVWDVDEEILGHRERDRFDDQIDEVATVDSEADNPWLALLYQHINPPSRGLRLYPPAQQAQVRLAALDALDKQGEQQDRPAKEHGALGIYPGYREGRDRLIVF